jgi:energy-converting hydrogenase Eha subunit G
VGCAKPCSSCSADGLTSSFVFVVGGDIADALVQPGAVVELAQAVQLGFQVARVGDLVQVPEFALEVAEERLDPRLVVRLTG